jgi:hypothetical protein
MVSFLRVLRGVLSFLSRRFAVRSTWPVRFVATLLALFLSGPDARPAEESVPWAAMPDPLPWKRDLP